ncbi:MAG: M1 family metallopeptidase [Anaerolineae bacterium]|nr:M1 family metallopeptidase [Anaerolineae bacterium]
MIHQPSLTPKAKTTLRTILATLLILAVLAACTTPTPTATPFPTNIPEPTAAPTPPEGPTVVSVPSLTPTHIASHLFDVAWDDRAIFREGLIGAEQAVLDQLSGASVYHIDLQIPDDFSLLQGREEVRYTNQEDEPLDEVYFRLFPNTAGGAAAVSAVKVDGQDVEPVYELWNSAVRVPLPVALLPGEQVVIQMDFEVEVPQEMAARYGLFGYFDGVLVLDEFSPVIPVYDDEGWNVELAPSYGDAIYSETAFYTVRVTGPAEMTLIASGTCTEPALNPDGSGTWTCVTGPMRDFNAVLGPDYQVESRVVEGITVNSLFYSTHHQGGERALDWATEAVRLFSTRFGPYPFAELDVVETPTHAGGIEYPGLVVINDTYYETLSERMEWVVVHEVGHQWWYSLVGNDQVDEPWLDEALVQYSTLLYYEDRYGAGVAAELLEQVFRQPYEELVESGRDVPAGLSVAAYGGADYGTVVYRKGPLYFHALRQEVGDEPFWGILQTYFARNRYGVATPEKWLAAVETVTGDEQRALYEQWIVEAAGQ